MLEELQFLPEYLLSHLNLTLTSLFFGILISVPLAIVASRIVIVERIVLGFAGAVQTIPSLALLAIMVPLLAWVGAPSIGYLPAFFALVLYCMLPILRNTVVGLRAVDPASIEAAKGVGMTSLERLVKVELPLALPMIFAGIRTATIWTVGTATLSTPVGAQSLGNYIFIGLQTRNTNAILVGCISAAALAFFLDGLVRAVAFGLERNIRWIVISVAAMLCSFYVYVGTHAVTEFFKDRSESIIVGAKAFTEQYILSEIIAQLIESTHEHPVEVRQSLGSTTAFDAICASDIDLYAEYTGTIWTHLMKRKDAPKNPLILYQEVTNYLKQFGVKTVASIGFNNTYALAMKRERAKLLGINSMSDLSRHKNLRLAGDYEFFGRPEWKVLKNSYDLRFKEQIPMDHGLMYQAIENNNVDIIVAFSTDGHIEANGLVILTDDQQVTLSYHPLILASPRMSEKNSHIIKTLTKLSDSINESTMQKLNYRVDGHKESPTVVAKDFVTNL